MQFTPLRTITALLVMTAFFMTSMSALAMAEETDEGTCLVYEGLNLAKNKGPILWYVRDPEKREAMENDMELFKMYNDAMKARKRRKAIGAALFYPGIVMIIGGSAAGIFQNAIGLYDEKTGNQIMIAGILGGVGLITPGIIFTAKESKEEKAYLDFIRKKYQVIPILKRDEKGDTTYALAFWMGF